MAAPPRPWCRAPFSSLHLDPRGDVRVCCQNEWLRLGNVETSGLAALWHGERIGRLRRALAEGDLSLGCEQCAVAGERADAYAVAFDRFAPSGDAPPWPLQLELALSNTCNLECTMCNGELSSAIRARREHRPPLRSPYGEAFFAELDAFLPHVESVVFLGGEPLLGREPLRVMDRLVELGRATSCDITTNGTIWNDRVARILSSLRVHLTVSVDGATDETVESIRVGADAGRIRRTIALAQPVLARGGGRLSLAFCLMRENAHELGAVLAWADELDVDVFVNQVAHPPVQSLVHAPPDVLEGLLAGLRAEDATRRGGLGRNLPVWTAQLAMVEHLAAERRDVGAVVERPVTVTPSHVAVVEAGPTQLIDRVVPGASDRFGLDLARLQGEPIWELARHLTDTLGETISSELRRLDDGGEERLVRFAAPSGGTTELRARLESGADARQRWILDLAHHGG